MTLYRFQSKPDLSSLDAALANRTLDPGFLRMQREVRWRVRLHRWLIHWSIPLVLGALLLLSLAALAVTVLISAEVRVGVLLGLALGWLTVATLRALETL